MASLRPIRPDSDPPTPIHLRALDDLRFIRETMDRSRSFTAISGLGEMLVGVSALIAALIAILQPTDGRWLAVWLAEAVVALTLTCAFTAVKASRAGESLFSRPGRQVVGGLTPPLIAGLIMTVALFGNDAAELLPGTWLLIYGTGMVTAGAFSVRIVPVMGTLFMATGVLAFVTPDLERDIVLACGFGGLHIVFGAVIARRYGG